MSRAMRSAGFAICVALVLLAATTAAAAAAAPSIGDVRLAGGPSPRQGQVQVQVDGQWVDAVCQTDNGDDNSLGPQVVCRQLGFTGGAQFFFPKNAALPAGNATVLTGALVCNGSEASLADCEFSAAEGDYIPNCTDNDNEAFFLGVVCAGAVQIEELRLAGGPSPSEGRVELLLANSTQWGTLCGTWTADGDPAVAQVVCRQLGYEPSQALSRGGGIFGSGGLPAAAAMNPGCNGEEEALEDCSLMLLSGNDTCHAAAFGVSCNGSQAITGMRLAGGPSEKAGRLEVKLLGNDSWHSVCASGWPDDFAPIPRLVCRSLGFYGGATRGLGWYATDQQPAIADLMCGPQAGDLNGCSFAAAESRQCAPETTVGVACEGSADIQELRLANGTTEREGRVEIRLNGSEWWTIGNSLEAAAAATVVCRQLGYGGGAVRGGAPYGIGPVLPNDAAGTQFEVPASKVEALSCRGNESNLNECSWMLARSAYLDLLSVACEGAQTISAVRLTNNGTAGGAEGRLEVQMGGKWGTVCGFTAWFDEGAAAAACTQLGFPGPARIVNGTAYTSDASLPILIAHVACGTAANQTSLNACSFDWNDPPMPTCEHADDVGLVCTKESNQ